MLSVLPEDLGRTYVDTEVMPLAMLERIRKYLKPSEVLSFGSRPLGPSRRKRQG